MKTISLKNLSELPEAAGAILEFAGSKASRIICFYGDLGAGKTTLIKEVCKQLGVTDSGSSPTFSLVNEYKILIESTSQNAHSRAGAEDHVIYHFDLYRLKNESEIYDIGYEEYLFSGHYCFIEWPEKMEHLLPENYVKVSIEVRGNERIICLF